jgi:hypothetical protein
MSEAVACQGPLSPVVKRRWLPPPADDAFRVFAGETVRWWPLTTHSVFGHQAQSCLMEG